MGIQSEFRQGMRVTDDRVMNVVEMCWASSIRRSSLINQHGGKAVGLTGQTAPYPWRKMLLKSDASDGEMLDIGLVARSMRIDPELIQPPRFRDFIP